MYKKDLWFPCNGFCLPFEWHFVGRQSHFIRGAAAPGVLLCCDLPQAVWWLCRIWCRGLQKKDEENKLLLRTSIEKYLERGSRDLIFLQWSLFAKVGVEDSVFYASAMAEALNVFWGITWWDVIGKLPIKSMQVCFSKLRSSEHRISVKSSWPVFFLECRNNFRVWSGSWLVQKGISERCFTVLSGYQHYLEMVTIQVWFIWCPLRAQQYCIFLFLPFAFKKQTNSLIFRDVFGCLLQ